MLIKCLKLFYLSFQNWTTTACFHWPPRLSTSQGTIPACGTLTPVERAFPLTASLVIKPAGPCSWHWNCCRKCRMIILIKLFVKPLALWFALPLIHVYQNRSIQNINTCIYYLICVLLHTVCFRIYFHFHTFVVGCILVIFMQLSREQYM